MVVALRETGEIEFREVMMFHGCSLWPAKLWAVGQRIRGSSLIQRGWPIPAHHTCKYCVTRMWLLGSIWCESRNHNGPLYHEIHIHMLPVIRVHFLFRYIKRVGYSQLIGA